MKIDCINRINSRTIKRGVVVPLLDRVLFCSNFSVACMRANTFLINGKPSLKNVC